MTVNFNWLWKLKARVLLPTLDRLGRFVVTLGYPLAGKVRSEIWKFVGGVHGVRLALLDFSTDNTACVVGSSTDNITAGVVGLSADNIRRPPGRKGQAQWGAMGRN